MRNFSLALSLLLILLSTSSCQSKKKSRTTTKAAEFPRMYEEKPRSILALPPINLSTDAEAKAHYMTTVEVPLTMAGYYVFPIEMTSENLKQDGIYATEQLSQISPLKFREYFGADAVLFTTIKRWDISYAVVASKLTIELESKLISTKTGAQLWTYSGAVVADLSSGNSSSIEGLIINAIATAVKTAATDYVDHAKRANLYMINSMPLGPYHEQYLQDQNVKILDQTPEDNLNPNE